LGTAWLNLPLLLLSGTQPNGDSESTNGNRLVWKMFLSTINNITDIPCCYARNLIII
jgi:hypothetical protein